MAYIQSLYDNLSNNQPQIPMCPVEAKHIHAIGYYCSNPQGRFLQANDTFAEILGFKNANTLLSHFENIAQQLYVDSNLRKQFMDLLKRESVAKGLEFQAYKKDGSKVWLLVSAELIRDAQGTPQLYQGFVTDITHKRYFGKRLLHLVNVTKRENREFLASAAHDLRTPLNVVLGYSSLLTSAGLSPDAQKLYAQRVKQNAEYLDRLIRHLTEFASIEAGGITFEKQSFNLHELLTDLCDEMKVLAERKHIELRNAINILPTETLFSDPDRIRQVLENVIGNAIKFTERGYVAVTAHALSTHFEILVEDTGSGIDPSQASKIFSAFVQGNEGVKNKHGGFGLGLSIANAIMRNLGGRIVLVKSQLGVGSVFSISLPLFKEEASTESSRDTDSQETGLRE